MTPDELPADMEAVAWRYRYPTDDAWQLTQDHDQAFKNTGEVEPLGVIPFASPVVPVGVSREEIAAIIMKTARLDLIAGFPPIGQIDNPRKIADAILAALRPTDTGANHD